ncbi:hypothetical protein I79_002443 [Cricetulus griseus]|uniref:Uncharacterized protein n=1 Tax=Cricetulus griseus TaxID=10029 RepID=G3GXF3_CRIGR|nr:hypothetical protein I79_002443 [Cricetulus griseus]
MQTCGLADQQAVRGSHVSAGTDRELRPQCLSQDRRAFRCTCFGSAERGTWS